MSKIRTKILLSTFLVILFTSLSYTFFLLQISDNILKSEAIEKLRNIIMLAGSGITVLAIVVAGFISFFLSRSITYPLSRLTQAAEAISRKDFHQHIRLHSFSEVEKLIYNFNHMARELGGYNQQIKKHIQKLEKIIREKTKELNYIYKIGREISFTLELEEVLDAIVKRTAQVLNLKICTILLVDQLSTDRLRVLRAVGINQKKIERQIIKPGEGISGWVWNRKTALKILDVDQDSRFIDRKKERYYTGALISVPLEAKDKIIGVLIGNNKIDGGEFTNGDLLLLKEIAIESAIAIENALLYKHLKEVYVHTISALASALETKDHYARSHSENVTKYAVAIAEKMNLPDTELEVIRQACQLHDLGKIGIHDYILTKPGKLTPEEWEEIKLHSLRGAQILEPIGFLSKVAELIKQHHERYDGGGYPLNIRGQEILLGARIMAIADAFDAMISARPYRKALSLSEAIAELKANRGTQFDPEVVEIFLKLLKSNPDLVKKSG